MRNCIILGSGRSGTSMVAGTLAKAGYFMGENLIPPTDANPKGYYEDVTVHDVNEALLAQVLPKRVTLFGRGYFRWRPLYGQRWLAFVPLGTEIPCPSESAATIRRVTQREPYCFKDPRFCYTLSAWRPYLRNVGFVCVFRAPATVGASILKDCKTSSYLHTLSMTFGRALRVWTAMYQHVLRIHRHEGDWLFLHYNQLLNREGLDRLEKFVGTSVDRSFPELALNRSFSDARVPRKTQNVYRELCDLAGYERG